MQASNQPLIALPTQSRHCFALNIHPRTNDIEPINCMGLSAPDAQDLANALPFLACGEESAVHAFGGSLLRDIAPNEQATMVAIAEDELRHATWLERLRIALPEPDISLPTEGMARFFKKLLTRKASLHFARVAALDLAVCHLLAPLLHTKASLIAAPEVRDGLLSIVRDEARHVQFAKQTAQRLGLSVQAQEQVNLAIERQLVALLAPVTPGLVRLARQSHSV